MGCNSHLTIEIKQKWGTVPTWNTWALDIPEARDYRIYEAMAGARGEEENAVVAPRGEPVDASDAVKYWIKRYGEDGHTHSWLSPKEFQEVIKRVEAINATSTVKWGLAPEWVALEKILLTLEEVYGEGNARVVFYFDN